VLAPEQDCHSSLRKDLATGYHNHIHRITPLGIVEDSPRQLPRLRWLSCTRLREELVDIFEHLSPVIGL